MYCLADPSLKALSQASCFPELSILHFTAAMHFECSTASYHIHCTSLRPTWPGAMVLHALSTTPSCSHNTAWCELRAYIFAFARKASNEDVEKFSMRFLLCHIRCRKADQGMQLDSLLGTQFRFPAQHALGLERPNRIEGLNCLGHDG